MGTNDSFYERASVVGNVTVPTVILPTVRGTVRRSDPDGGHAQPYFSGLAGKSLTLTVGVVDGASSNFTINFITDNYLDAIAAVNAVSPTDFKWLESNGFAAIQSQHAGGKNYLQTTGGTAAAILGIPVGAEPGSYSQAGDIESAPANKVQKNRSGTKLLAHDENLTTANINRAILGALQGLDLKSWDMDGDVVQYRVFTATVYNPAGAIDAPQLRIDDVQAGLSRLNVRALIASRQETSDLSQAIAIMTNASPPKALYAPDDSLVKAQYVTYGASSTPFTPAAGGVTWGTPSDPGKNVENSAVWTSLKGSALAISAIDGDVVTVPGATFETWKVWPGDKVVISGATNVSPFSHNGVFAVVDIISETELALRPLGSNELSLDGSTPPPRLNQTLGVGQIYGNLAVFVGDSIMCIGPSGAPADYLFIRTSATLTQGSTFRVRIPVSVNLREALSHVFLRNQTFDQDDEVAYLNKLNVFTKLNEFQQGIKLDSPTKDPITSLQVARITEQVNSPADNLYALLREQQVTNANMSNRTYVNRSDGRLTYTINARYNPISTNWDPDNGAERSIRVDVVLDQYVRVQRENAGGTMGTDDWDQTLFQFRLDSNLADLGGFNDTLASVPRMEMPTGGSTTFDTYALLFAFATPTGETTRVYSRVSGFSGIVITTNAFWTQSAGHWQKDVNGVRAGRHEFSAFLAGVQQRQATSNTPWSDSQWDGNAVSWDVLDGLGTISGMQTTLTPPAPGVSTNKPLWVLGSYATSPYFLKISENTDINGRKQRTYIDANGVWYLAWNCYWDKDAALWKSDTPTVGGSGGGNLLAYNGTTFYAYRKRTDGGGAANTWTNSVGAGGWDVIDTQWQDEYLGASGQIEAGYDLLTSGAKARTARLLTKYVPSATSGDATLGMTLIWESDPATGSTPKMRMYVGNVNNAIRFTSNCYWDGSNWNKDVSGTQAVSMSLKNNASVNAGFELQRRTAANNTAWADTAWDINSFRIDFTGFQNWLYGSMRMFFNYGFGVVPLDSVNVGEGTLFMTKTADNRTALAIKWSDGNVTYIAASAIGA